MRPVLEYGSSVWDPEVYLFKMSFNGAEKGQLDLERCRKGQLDLLQAITPVKL